MARKKKKNEGPIQWLEFSLVSLSKIDDIEFATLKAHVVLEDALKFLLARRLGAEDDDDFGLRFATLVDVALAGVNNSHLEQALKALNMARNDVAHAYQMESTKFDGSLGTFVREIRAMQGQNAKWPSKLAEQLPILRKAFDEAADAIFDIAINGPKRGAVSPAKNVRDSL